MSEETNEIMVAPFDPITAMLSDIYTEIADVFTTSHRGGTLFWDQVNAHVISSSIAEIGDGFAGLQEYITGKDTKAVSVPEVYDYAVCVLMRLRSTPYAADAFKEGQRLFLSISTEFQIPALPPEQLTNSSLLNLVIFISIFKLGIQSHLDTAFQALLEKEREKESAEKHRANSVMAR